MLIVTAPHIKAQTIPIESEILPPQGGANTTILLRFTTLNSSVGNVLTADIFWDNHTVGLNQQGVLGANGAYNYNLTVPTEPPFSDPGNHTIRVDSTVFNYGTVTFSFTFNITEFIPSPEYLALNATYYSLLANYTDLFNNYTQLLDNYTELSTNFTMLTTEHNQDLQNYNTLLANYNSLTANYNSISANYNTLTTDYQNLTLTYSSLSSNYNGIQTNFQSLNSSYVTLIQDYNLLNSSYAGLLSNYNSVTGQLDFSRNLNYILIITTIALAIMTFYFAILKPKKQQKTR